MKTIVAVFLGFMVYAMTVSAAVARSCEDGCISRCKGDWSCVNRCVASDRGCRGQPNRTFREIHGNERANQILRERGELGTTRRKKRDE